MLQRPVWFICEPRGHVVPEGPFAGKGICSWKKLIGSSVTMMPENSPPIPPMRSG